MPAGSTSLDFAFSIHSFLGSHCIGAKVNHKLVPLNYHLKSGDQVEILTSRTQHVQPEWLNFAATAKARGKIQAILRRENREKQRTGEEMLHKFMTEKDVEASTANIERLRIFHSLSSRDELFQAIADEKIKPDDNDIDFLHGKTKSKGWRKYIPFIKWKQQQAGDNNADIDFVKNLNRKQVLTLNEDSLAKCQIAPCCRPIPGDDVMGYITPQNTLEIHKRSCDTAVKLKTRYGNNIIACNWDTHKTLFFDCRLLIKGMDNQGILYAIADVLHKQNQYFVKRITLETNDGIFEGTLDIAVFDTADVKKVCESLMQIENVTKVARID